MFEHYFRYRDAKVQRKIAEFHKDEEAGRHLEAFANAVMKLEEKGWVWHSKRERADWDFRHGDLKLDVKGCKADKYGGTIFVELLSSPGSPSKWTLSDGYLLFIDTSWADRATFYCYTTEQLLKAATISEPADSSVSSSSGVRMDTKKVAPLYKKILNF